MQRWMQKGLDDSKRTEVRRTSGGHQSNVDSNRSLMFRDHFSGYTPTEDVVARIDVAL
jgi:hypothetical protein